LVGLKKKITLGRTFYTSLVIDTNNIYLL